MRPCLFNLLIAGHSYRNDKTTRLGMYLFSVSGLIRKQVITDSASNELHLYLVLREHLVIWFNQKVLEGL